MSQTYRRSDQMEFWASLLGVMAKTARTVEDMAEAFKDVWPFSEPEARNNTSVWPDPSEWCPGLTALAPFWGTVPDWGQAALKDRCRELERQCAAQQEEIAELRRALAEKDPEAALTERRFQEILETQNRQFEQLMGGLVEYFGDETALPAETDQAGSDSDLAKTKTR